MPSGARTVIGVSVPLVPAPLSRQVTKPIVRRRREPGTTASPTGTGSALTATAYILPGVARSEAGAAFAGFGLDHGKFPIELNRSRRRAALSHERRDRDRE